MSVRMHDVENREQVTSALFSQQPQIKDPDAVDPSVQILQATSSDMSGVAALLGNGPEIPAGRAESFGGRSFTELMVQVQKILAEMSYKSKIVNREQSVTYGRAKAQTMDDGAEKMLSGATAAFAGSMLGGMSLVAFNLGGVGYMMRYGVKRTDVNPAQNSKSSLGEVELRPSSVKADPEISNPSMGKPAGDGVDNPMVPSQSQRSVGDGGTTSGVQDAGAGGGASQPNPASAVRQNGPDPRGTGSVGDDLGGTEPDGAFVSPIMGVFNSFGSASSTVINGVGDFIDKHKQADKLQLDADGQLFDTYAGEQSQFYQDADKNTQRALGLIGSLVGQIYNTNTSIIANLPR